MKILFIESFYGGSHKQMYDALIPELPCTYDLITLPSKKWPWRARCSALTMSQMIPKNENYSTLFCSSVLSLSELIGLRPDLQCTKKIVYFHENQLVYPIRKIKERDFQFGYNQITTCLAADVVLFNSKFNMESFLSSISKFIKLMPDCRPKDLSAQIRSKSRVLYFPINFPSVSMARIKPAILHIVWPHRWEFDKGPEEFFNVVFRLKEAKLNFKLSVVGETFADVPEIFGRARTVLDGEIWHWGYVESKEKYYEVLAQSHVVVSTAKHEFYGVAMLEAAYCGCLPLAPDALAYPEIYDVQCLYKNEMELYNKLKRFCENPAQVEDAKRNIKMDFKKYSKEHLMPLYLEVLRDS